MNTRWLSSLGDDLRESRLYQGLAVAALLAVVTLIIGPFFGTPPFFFYLMFWTSLALALNILFGFTGYVPFGYFAFYGVGSYAVAMSFIHLGLPMLAGVLVSGLAGVLLAVLFFPMLKLDGIYFAIANFAAAYAIRIGVNLTPRELTGGATGLELAQAYAPVQTYYTMFAVALVIVVTSLWLSRSRTGLILKAIREDAIAAETCGINRGRVRSYAWLLSAGFGGVLGGIDAWNTAVVDPNSAFDVMISIKPFLYTIFGGVGTVLGPIFGSFSLYMIDTWIQDLVPTGTYLLTGFVLMLVVLLVPRGIIAELRERNLLGFGSETTDETAASSLEVSER